MSPRIIVHSEARSDVIDIAYYIAEDNMAAADRFADAVDAAFKRLAAMPSLGATREYGNPVLKGMRMWPVPGFAKHIIFYHATNGELHVVRVLHSARDIAGIFRYETEIPAE